MASPDQPDRSTDVEFPDLAKRSENYQIDQIDQWHHPINRIDRRMSSSPIWQKGPKIIKSIKSINGITRSTGSIDGCRVPRSGKKVRKLSNRSNRSMASPDQPDRSTDLEFPDLAKRSENYQIDQIDQWHHPINRIDRRISSSPIWQKGPKIIKSIK